MLLGGVLAPNSSEMLKLVENFAAFVLLCFMVMWFSKYGVLLILEVVNLGINVLCVRVTRKNYSQN